MATNNFAQYPLSTSNLLNNNSTDASAAAAVGDQINTFFLSLLSAAQSPGATTSTKIAAMDTMREMMKLVLLADNAVGQELRKSKYCVVIGGRAGQSITWDAKLDAIIDTWTDATEDEYFDEEERNGGVMTGRFRELTKLAKKEKVFKRMKDILLCVDRDVYVC